MSSSSDTVGVASNYTLTLSVTGSILNGSAMLVTLPNWIRNNASLKWTDATLQCYRVRIGVMVEYDGQSQQGVVTNCQLLFCGNNADTG